MKKIKLILLLIPLLFTVGFSSWVILYSFDLTAEYKNNPLADYYNFYYSATYDGTQKIPTVKDDVDIEFSTIEYKHYYSDEEDPTINTGCPTNAGLYDIEITASWVDSKGITQTGKCKVRYEIFPIKIKTKLIELTYDEVIAKNTSSKDYRKWTYFYDLLNEKIDFTYEDGTELPTNLNPAYLLTEITNGDENCTYSDDSNNFVAGSTYAVRISLYGSSAQNYQIFDYEELYKSNKNQYKTTGSAILKYKTVLYNSEYFTIEDCIEKDGQIVIKGNSTNTIFTAFSNLKYYNKTNSYNLKSSLWIPFDDANNLYSTTTGNVVYSCLFIPKGITLNVSGTINVCGSFALTSHTTYRRGVLFNNGTINLTGKLYSYGYIKGDGFIDAKSGSEVYDLMRFYNYPGSAGITLSLSHADMFPMSAYSIHNISCKIKIDCNATFYIKYKIIISFSSIDIDMDDVLVILGSGGLFDLSSGYVIKYAEDTTGNFYGEGVIDNLYTSYKTSNQDITQRDVIEIYGTFHDNIVSIEKSGQGITTGPNYAMPIGFMKILLKKDNDGNVGNGTLQANAYKFYPGSYLEIDEGASLSISSGINVVFYDETFTEYYTMPAVDATKVRYGDIHSAWYNSEVIEKKGSQLIVNGNLSVSGALGGNIQTNSTTGVLYLSSLSATVKKLDAEKYDASDNGLKISIVFGGSSAVTSNSTVNASGNVDKTIKNFTNTGLFISMYDAESENYYWTSAADAQPFKLKFYDVDKTTQLCDPKTVYVLSPQDGTNYVYEFLGNEFTPSKNHFVFKEWLLSDGSVAKGYEISSVKSNTVKELSLYASWYEINYTFNYNAIYIDPITKEEIFLMPEEFNLINNSDITFTYNDIVSNNITIPTTASYNSTLYKGWFVLANGSLVDISDTLTFSMFNLINQSTIKIVPIYDENDSEKIIGYEGIIDLTCRFTENTQYIIKFSDALDKFNDLEAVEDVNINETIGSIMSTDIIDDFNKTPEYIDYLYGWSFYSKHNDLSDVTPVTIDLNWTINQLKLAIESYNETLSEKIPIENNTIWLYALVKDKDCTLTYNLPSGPKYQYFESNQECLAMNGADVPEKLGSSTSDTKDYEKFLMWKYTLNGQEKTVSPNNKIELISGCVITLDPLYTHSYYEYKITLSPDSYTNLTVKYNSSSGEAISNGTFVKENTVIYISAAGKTIAGIGYQLSKLTVNGKDFTSGKTTSISSPTEIVAKSEDFGGCLISGTLITMADGTKKYVEDLVPGDKVLVFNHYTGKYDESFIMYNTHSNIEKKYYDILNLLFDDDTKLSIYGDHYLFNVDTKKYELININNYINFIGNRYYAASFDGTEYIERIITLKEAFITNEYVSIFGPTPAFHLNVLSNDLLTIPGDSDPFINIFEMNELYKYDEEQMKLDIELYGLMSYETLAEYIPYEIFEYYHGEYLNVAIGKGYTTLDRIIELIRKYLS